jgi:hypothetical protein
VLHHQEFASGVDVAALAAFAVPGVAKPVLPSGRFLRTATTGDLLKPLQGVPFTIFAVAVVSVSSSALHLPVLSVSPPLPHEASKAKQRTAKNERMVVRKVY